jgi:hypothetical protein
MYTTLATINAVFQRDVIAYVTYENIATGKKSECASKMTYKAFFNLVKESGMASFTISPTCEMKNTWAKMLKINGFNFYDIPSNAIGGHKYKAFSE